MTARKKNNMLYVFVSILLLLAVALSTLGIARARYNREDMLSVVYGESHDQKNTLSAEGEVYDFGVWSLGDSDENFTHTVVISAAQALSGRLTFSWDSETAEKKDVTAAPAEVAVNEADGLLEYPFSLTLVSTRSERATLTVEWIPEGESEATLSARYLVSLNPYSATAQAGVNTPALSEEAGFLSKEMLKLSATAPDGAQELMLATGSSLTAGFAAGVKYFTSEYPQGVELLRSSVICLPCENGALNTVLDLTAQGNGSPLTVSLGESTTSCISAVYTPLSESALSVSLSDSVLSHVSPLTVTVSEAAALSDSVWNNGSGGAQLSWRVERYAGGEYSAVSLSENFTASTTHAASGGLIVFRAPTGEQAAGAYRLTVTQSYNDLSINEKTQWFFIDYR